MLRVGQRISDANSSKRTQLAIDAIEELAGTLDSAVTEIEQRTGNRPEALADMANAYRTVIRELERVPLKAAELAAICDRIAASAEAALVLIRTIFRPYEDSAKAGTTIH